MQVTHDSRSALSRARFFLEKADASPAESRVEFEACLEAAIVFARAAVHRFQSMHEKHPQWKDWWDGLSSNPAVNFFRVERDWILKEAPPKVGQNVFVPCIDLRGEVRGQHIPVRAAEFYYFEDPATPATTTVARHLETVANLLAQAEQRFK